MRIDEHPVNPLQVKATGGRQLAGHDLMAFKMTKMHILAMMQTAPSATRVAQAQQ